MVTKKTGKTPGTTTKNESKGILPGGEQISRVIETRDFVTKVTFGIEQTIKLSGAREYESIKPSMFYSTELNSAIVDEENLAKLRDGAVHQYGEYRDALIESDRERVRNEDAMNIDSKLKAAIETLNDHFKSGAKLSAQFVTKSLKHISDLKIELDLISAGLSGKYTGQISLFLDEASAYMDKKPSVESEETTTKTEEVKSTEVVEIVPETAKTEDKKEEVPTTDEKKTETPLEKPKKREIPTVLSNGARGSAKVTTTPNSGTVKTETMASPLDMSSPTSIIAERSASLGLSVDDSKDAPANPLGSGSLFGKDTTTTQTTPAPKAVKEAGETKAEDLPY